jgi:hypothetical protein
LPGPERRTLATIADLDYGVGIQLAPGQISRTSGGAEGVFSAVSEKQIPVGRPGLRQGNLLMSEKSEQSSATTLKPETSNPSSLPRPSTLRVFFALAACH